MTKAAKIFWDEFYPEREINKEFYLLVPEDKFDFRIVDRQTRKSDSVKESLIHQIGVTRNYNEGLKTGILIFAISEYVDYAQLLLLRKDNLIDLLDESTNSIRNILEEDIDNKSVTVPWANEEVPAIDVLHGLYAHEVLHTGWNLAIMDCLDIPRFDKLKQRWG